MNQVLWRNFLFDIYNFDDLWSDRGGVYIFSAFDHQNGWWEVLYVGETGSFRNRIPYHKRWIEAVSLGATHVLATTTPAWWRRWVERALISEYQPPLNVQHRPTLADLAKFAAQMNR